MIIDRCMAQTESELGCPLVVFESSNRDRSTLSEMEVWNLFLVWTVIIHSSTAGVYFQTKSFDCGPYGFICEGTTKLRLCEGDNLIGPAFKCPASTVCNEDSSDVCDNAMTYIEPELRTIRCHRNERIADPNVPDCKGYILCIPNKNRFQGIKFKCAGNTIFNGYTRTCSTPEKYRCPINNTTKPSLELYGNEKRRIDSNVDHLSYHVKPVTENRPIECKNYKFSVTDDKSPVRAAFFCPSRPVRGENSVRCTVFSSKYCLTLERDDEDQFIQNFGAAYRKPRK